MNEYYKPDYYGPECTSSVKSCVWSGGNAQASDTGNAEWWCYINGWSQCADSAIGTKVGGVTCTGVNGNNRWAPNSQVLPESSYSCTEGKDNDADGKADCEDTDCDGSIKGNVKNTDDQPIAQADITAKKGIVNFKSAITGQDGNYNIPISCGTYDVIASHPDYGPGTKGNLIVQPSQQVTADFTLALGSSCEGDCTFISDETIHASCHGKNGCSFYDDKAKEVCDLSQPGWVRDYDADNFIVCAEGSPQPKVEIEASVSCSGGTLVKVTRIVYYNGKPVKLVVAACG
ncbi:MAG: carboxypeptidase-like regulatory domain-containing protein [Nanoarchaeota archaeon]